MNNFVIYPCTHCIYWPAVNLFKKMQKLSNDTNKKLIFVVLVFL